MRSAVVVCGLALLLASQAGAYQITDNGRVEGRVLDAQTLEPIVGAVVAVQWTGPATTGQGNPCVSTTDATGAYSLMAPLGLKASELALGRAIKTSIIGLAVSIFSGGLKEKIRIVMVNGVPITVSASGHKTFHGMVELDEINTDRLSATAQAIALAPEGGTAASRTLEAAFASEIDIVAVPDRVCLGDRDKLSVQLRYQYSVPGHAPKKVTATLYLWADPQRRPPKGKDPSSSCELYDDGKHDDGGAGDGVYGGSLAVPRVPKWGADAARISFTVVKSSAHRAGESRWLPVVTSQTEDLSAAIEVVQAAELEYRAGSMRWCKPETALAIASHWRAAALLRPESPGIVRGAMWRLMDTDQVDEALAVHTRASEVAQQDAAVESLHLQALTRGDRFSEIIDRLGDLELTPKDDRSYFLGYARLRAGERDAASLLLAPFKRDKKWEDEPYRSGVCEWQALEEAEKARTSPNGLPGYSNSLTWSGRIGQPVDPTVLAEARACALEALRATPKHKKAKELCSSCMFAYYRVGDVESMIGLVDEVLALTGGKTEAAGDLRLYAKVFDARGDTAAAISLLRRAVEVEPSDPAGHVALAMLVADAAEAVELCERAVELGSSDPRPYLLLGSVAEEAGDMEQAEAKFRLGTERAPEVFDLHHRLAKILMGRGQTDAAMSAFRDAATVGRARVVVVGGPAFKGEMMVAPIWTKAKRRNVCGYRAPLAQFDFYIAEFGQDVLPSAGAAEQPDGAIEQPRYNTAVCRYAVGDALMNIGLPEQALPLLTTALDKMPGSLQVRLSLARAYVLLGDMAKARSFYGEVLSVCPDCPGVAEEYALAGRQLDVTGRPQQPATADPVQPAPVVVEEPAPPVDDTPKPVQGPPPPTTPFAIEMVNGARVIGLLADGSFSFAMAGGLTGAMMLPTAQIVGVARNDAGEFVVTLQNGANLIGAFTGETMRLIVDGSADPIELNWTQVTSVKPWVAEVVEEPAEPVAVVEKVAYEVAFGIIESRNGTLCLPLRDVMEMARVDQDTIRSSAYQGHSVCTFQHAGHAVKIREGDSQVYVDNQPRDLSMAAYGADRMYVPADFIAVGLGYTVHVDTQANTITCETKGRTVIVTSK